MFRLLTLNIYKHPLLEGKTFELTNPVELDVSNYYSIVIGPNGTGKSYLLSFLIEIFNDITLLKKGFIYNIKRRFSIEYLLDDDKFSITSNKEFLSIQKNGYEISLEKIKLPNKWVASSVTIYDKYPILNYIRSLQIPEYKYLGIRAASNNAFISRIKINAVLYFVEALRKQKSDSLESVLKSLGLNPNVQIIFSGGPMLKLEKKERKFLIYKNSSKILEPHNAFIKKNKLKTSYRADNYKKYLEDYSSIELVYEFMHSYRSSFEKASKSSMEINYTVDLISNSGYQSLLHDWKVLSIMLDLELLKISDFLITKDSIFNYEESSSGENHLLISLLGIIANLEDNSLVIIDEPEISLHPNWQIDYIEILKSIIDKHSGVNVVIATHSHFLVSSLKNEESRITSMWRDKETSKIKVEELDFETYGWDPESILYNVFEVATMRNKYFELDLSKLISLISTKSKNKEEIRKLKDKLGKYIIFNDADPLKLLITQAENYLNS
ncbi:MAG: AAA family ATPase [Salinivirgaceae bacterium]|jgi:predicted ATPase